LRGSRKAGGKFILAVASCSFPPYFLAVSAQFRRLLSAALAVAFLSLAAPDALAQSTVVLPAQAEQSGSLNTAVQSSERSYQWVYDASLLSAIPLGAKITGMAYRLNGGQPTLPASDRVFSSYDVQLATSVFRPSFLSSTYSVNMGSDVTTVRSGPLTIAPNSLPGGATPNAFGPVILFTTPFTYLGGHLITLVRHTGNGVDAPILDGVADLPGAYQGRSNSTVPGSYSATTSNGGGFATVARFTWEPSTDPQNIVVYNGPTTAHPQFTAGITFGSVPAGTTGQTHILTIGNSGSLPLTGVSVTLTGTGAGDYIVTQPANTVAPGATTTFELTLHPSSTGGKLALVHVLSNDPDNPSVNQTIVGTAMAALNSNFREANTVIGQPDLQSFTGVPSASTTPGPTAMALSPTGKLIVTDQNARRVTIWNQIPNTDGVPANIVLGKPNFTSVTAGTSSTLMSECNGVTVAPDGRLIVCDSGNNRVLIWNSVPTTSGAAANVVIGQTDFVTATAGLSATKLDRPVGVLLTPSGKLLVTDQHNNRVLIYNSIPTANGAAADVVIGQSDMTTGTVGAGATGLNGAWGLAQTANGKLLVADQFNHRVLIFDSVPTANGASANVVVGQADFTNTTAGTSATRMDAPLGVTVSPEGKLYVAEGNNDRVVIFNSVPTTNGAAADAVLGQFTLSTGLTFVGGVQAASMDAPYATLVAPDGRLLVAGRTMCRIMIFNPASLSLTAPIAGAFANRATNVSFTMPETAATSTLSLSFDDGSTVRSLTLASAQEKGGAHSFAFDPRNPTASSAIAVGGAIPDGTYTVSLAYHDQSGHTILSNSIGNVKVETTAPALSLPDNITVEATSAAGQVVTYTASASDGGSGLASSSFLPASGSTFPIGTTTVNATATDNAGNVGNGSFTVTVQDTAAPTVTPPSDVVMEATGPDGAMVTYLDATANDAVGVTSLTYSQNSGTIFPLGVTTVTVTAKDAANNPGTATFTVTVKDTTPPFVIPSSTQITAEASGPNGATVNYAAATVFDTASTPVVMYSQASGTVFPLGTTTVTVTATDPANNAGTATFTVTVQDMIAPLITPPADITVEAASPSGTIVNYPNATAQDAVGVQSLNYSKAKGEIFPIGTTTVTITAKDAAGNTSTATFNITVQDTTAPLVPPSTISIAATGASGTVVDYADPNVTDAVGVVETTFSQASGTLFPVGTTVVTVTARDAAGNVGTGQMTVTVNFPGHVGDIESDFNPTVNGDIYALAVQPDGKIIIGGTFTAVGGVPRGGIARLNIDGALDESFGPGAADTVNTISILADGKIIIGGTFTSVGGVARSRLARLNADGSLDMGFHSNLGSIPVVATLAQPDGKIVAGGFAGPLKRFNPDGSLDNFQTPFLTTVTGLVLQPDGKIIVAGGLKAIRLNPDGSQDSGYASATANLAINSVAVRADGKTFVAGPFFLVMNQMNPFIARINPNGSVDGSFSPQPDGEIHSMAVQTDGKVFVTGEFQQFFGDLIKNRGLARLSVVAPDQFPGNLQGGKALAMEANGFILVAGSFEQASGVKRGHLARIRNTKGTQSLTASSSSRIEWLRSATLPEAQVVAFDLSTDGGGHWTRLGSASRVDGGWELTGLSLPEHGRLRAHAWVASGYNNTSNGLLETQADFDNATLLPTLATPAPDAVTASPVSIAFTLPETALANSVTLDFDDGTTTRTLTLAATQETAVVAHTFTFVPSAPVTSSGGAIADGVAIPDGVYRVTLSYRDATGNLAATASADHVRIDTTPPDLVLPGNLTQEATGPNGATVTFDAHATDTGVGVATLTASPASGSVFPLGTTRVDVSASDSLGNSRTGFFNVTVQDLTAPSITPPPNVTAEATSDDGATVTYQNATASDAVSTPTLMYSKASGSVFPLGSTTVTVTAKDDANNTNTATFTVTVQDTIDPVIEGPFSPLIFVEGTPLPNYAGQAQTTDKTAVTVTQDPLPNSATHSGLLTVTLTGTDAGGNSGEKQIEVDVRPVRASSTAKHRTGEPVPGHGSPDGPPDDALLATFGVPATDNANDIAYLATWTSASGKGSGVFKDDQFIAKAGGPVTGLGTATFKSFTDPVVDAGHVAFLATLAKVSKAQAAAVVRTVGAGVVEVVAQAGVEAPGTGGAKFKSFKTVAIEGDAVAFLAQLAVGTGTPKVIAGTDWGIWIKDGSDLPVLALREGRTFGDPGSEETIKTLTAFKAGNGSPGQGRGWFQVVNGVPSVTAYVVTIGKTQAVLNADNTGAITTLLASGDNLDTQHFVTLGLPAVNADGQSVLLSSLQENPSLAPRLGERANRAAPIVRGAVFDSAGDGSYEPLALVGDGAPDPSTAVFSIIKDPVLANDGVVAFPATRKGSGAHGLGATTLWWQRPGNTEPELLAAGGGEPAELPNAQWKAFPSLAIAAHRGPVFTATLVPGKGGVIKTKASGVWAVDFNGTLRLLFQNGDPIDGKTLKSFTLLNAVRGSEGVTRSINDEAGVVWLATFTNRTTAIVRTEVP
jgi:uncharacterized delta-60 repeat protein